MPNQCCERWACARCGENRQGIGTAERMTDRNRPRLLWNDAGRQWLANDSRELQLHKKCRWMGMRTADINTRARKRDIWGAGHELCEQKALFKPTQLLQTEVLQKRSERLSSSIRAMC